MMFTTLRQLRAMGVMGMNRRNCDYTLMYNPRRLYPLVDDKLQTKHLAEAAGIAPVWRGGGRMADSSPGTTAGKSP